MVMIDLISKIELRLRGLEEIVARLSSGSVEQAVSVSGLAGSLTAVFIAFLYDRLERQLIVVANDQSSTLRLHDDLQVCLGSDSVRAFGKEHRGVFDPKSEIHVEYINSLRYLLANKKALVVCGPQALSVKVPPPDLIKRLEFTLEVGRAYSLDHTTKQLAGLNFERKDFVETFGDYAIRGGILDIFPFVGDNPVRIEFFGETVESIREFDSLSQRSVKELTSATIVPDVLSKGEELGTAASLLDYLQSDAIIVMEEPGLIQNAIASQHNEHKAKNFQWSELQEMLPLFSRLNIHHIATSSDQSIKFSSITQPSFNGSVKLLKENLHDLQRAGYTIVITADGQAELSRLEMLLDEASPDLDDQSDKNESLVELDLSSIEFSLDAFHAGFILPEERIAVFTEHQIFNRLRRREKKRRTRFKSVSKREVYELRKGDYVVHEDHGIGRFDALQKITVRGIEQEVIRLLYDGSDTLYVNLNYLGKVQKYSSKEGHIPKLSKLGSADWERLKSRAKNRIKDIARDLIKLYARRKKAPGFSFPKDTTWQKELEASFMYEDTFDQAKSTIDIKQDMEAANPMDRLVCGDVGFGKTEVAVRAAFKAVLGGKQVAILVPTTILAMQHYHTFLDRTSRYSTSIQVLSRFKSKKEQAQIINQLMVGSIDIVIGTHRLLSKDVEFKDLGLLIIDEEHRFGVSAKERLRQLRAHVDTLTLTATPIPRTLHFSLMGARDLSIIATPPRNRLPVITEITQYSDDLAKEAVNREIRRGGQVYFVHDRIHNIGEITLRLQSILPGVRVRFAHGQMHARELEEVMMDFLERRFDVLVSTKIIESGLDMPNVNTIIINRADKFGMAELYQLRGRVGRSNLQAFAYLLTPPISVLTRNTIQRLQAVEEFTELGSGFSLAMRDLEIRGAGNLLGGEQSGFIETMGFETYNRILEDAVSELREQEFRELFGDKQLPISKVSETVVEADLEALIPTSYVESDIERLNLYRRLYGVTTNPQLDEVASELRDRFGVLPSEAENLFEVVRIRLAASQLGFRKIIVSKTELEIEFPPESESSFYDGEQFQHILARVSTMQDQGTAVQQSEKKLKLHVKLPRIESHRERLVFVTKFMSTLSTNVVPSA
jgi:transcription-repair coupling factor (superfamily II helicase)